MLLNRFFYEQLNERILSQIEKEICTLVGTLPVTQANADDVVTLGYTTPDLVEGGIERAMEIWVNAIDNLLLKADPDSEAYVKLWLIRGLTYPEYNLVFTGAIEEQDYQHFRGFAFLQLRDRVDKLNFTSRYANDLETYQRLLQDCHLPLLSELSKKKIPIRFPKNALEKHAYITGGTGSGKSELMKLVIYDMERSSAKKRNASIFLIDPHGDISSECLGFVMNEKQRDRIIYVNPFIHKEIGVEQKFTPIINPFELREKTEDNIKFLTQHLTSAFLEILQDVSLSFQMELLLTMCITTVLRLPNPSIKHLVRFMDDANNKDLVQFGLQSPFETHRDFFKNKFLIHEYKQTKVSITTRLTNLLAYDEFNQMISGKSTIDLEQAMNSGKVVLFNLAQGRLGPKVSSAYGRLLVAYMQGLAIRRVDVPKEKRKPVFLFVDECQYYISPSIEEILTGARKFKLYLMLAQQIVGQKMSAEMEQIVMSNTAIKVTGKNDRKSYEQYSKNTGIKLENLQKLEEYHFFVHNRQDGVEKKPFMMKSPPFLVDLESHFYMKAAERKALLKWFAEESGYYVKVEHRRPDNTSEEERKPSDERGQNGKEDNGNNEPPLNPAFTDF